MITLCVRMMRSSYSGFGDGFVVVPDGRAEDAEAVVVWTNEYHDTRVFSTTIGHYDETVADGRYLDLVTRGLLWSCKKLNDRYLK